MSDVGDVLTDMTARDGRILLGLAAVLRDAARAGLYAARTQSKLSWRQRFGASVALLIDLDGAGLKVSELAAAVTRLQRAVGPFEAMFAAGHPITSRSAAPVCAHLGVQKLPTTRRANSADHALLNAARLCSARGTRAFVIIGADHAFAELPGHVTVVRVGSVELSRRLTARADVIFDLPKRVNEESRAANTVPSVARVPAKFADLGLPPATQAGPTRQRRGTTRSPRSPQ